jgi:hypothetical protein
MAKISKTLEVTLTKNTSVEKGGAWLLTICQCGHLTEDIITHSAWSNPSAAKRYLKAYVQQNTPRKSIKMEVKVKDMNDKPINIIGELSWKADA